MSIVIKTAIFNFFKKHKLQQRSASEISKQVEEELKRPKSQKEIQRFVDDHRGTFTSSDAWSHYNNTTPSQNKELLSAGTPISESIKTLNFKKCNSIYDAKQLLKKHQIDNPDMHKAWDNVYYKYIPD